MNDIEQLRELVGVLADMPGDGADLVRPHIEPDLIHEYAQRCSHVILHAVLGTQSRPVHHDEMLEMLSSTYLSAFALGCAWGKMRAGSGEK